MAEILANEPWEIYPLRHIPGQDLINFHVSIQFSHASL